MAANPSKKPANPSRILALVQNQTNEELILSFNDPEYGQCVLAVEKFGLPYIKNFSTVILEQDYEGDYILLAETIEQPIVEHGVEDDILMDTRSILPSGPTDYDNP